LLEHADSMVFLKTFPVNPLSSRPIDRCVEGMMALWLIEGVRQGGKFPSLNPPYYRDAVDGKESGPVRGNVQKKLVQAYRAWWAKVKNLPADKAKAIDPLQGTGLSLD
jgi:hypothetical protein